jgi:hypothetical protein
MGTVARVPLKFVINLKKVGRITKKFVLPSYRFIVGNKKVPI